MPKASQANLNVRITAELMKALQKEAEKLSLQTGESVSVSQVARRYLRKALSK
jgi:hypothetical protein